MLKRTKIIIFSASITMALALIGTGFWYYSSRSTEETSGSSLSIATEEITENAYTSDFTEIAIITTTEATERTSETSKTEVSSEPTTETITAKAMYMLEKTPESKDTVSTPSESEVSRPITVDPVRPDSKQKPNTSVSTSSEQSKPKIKTKISSDSKPRTKSRKTSETPKEISTEKPTEVPDSLSCGKTECKHTWVWKTTTKTIHHDVVTHQEPVYDYDDGHFEYVEHEWVQCNHCLSKFKTHADYKAHPCYPQCTWSTIYTSDETYYPPEIIDYKTVVDKKAYDEEVEENDYQYCSICGKIK